MSDVALAVMASKPIAEKNVSDSLKQLDGSRAVGLGGTYPETLRPLAEISLSRGTGWRRQSHLS